MSADIATPEAEALRRIWTDIFGRDPGGPEANFFELGGNSLALTRLKARIAEELGVEIKLRIFFERPTLGALADYIAEARGKI